MTQSRYLKDGTKMSAYTRRRRRLAIMDFRNIEPNATQAEIDKVVAAYWQVKEALGYTSYTEIKGVTRMSYPRIFAVCKTLHAQDPYQIHFNVNRMGENVYFKLTNKTKGE